MNKTSILLLFKYLSKKKKLRNDMRMKHSEITHVLRKYSGYIELLQQLALTFLSGTNGIYRSNPRSIWCLKRNNKWWNEVVPAMSDKEFKSNFRLQRSTYFNLLKQVAPYLEKSNTKYRTSIPIDKVVCCALYQIGSSAELRTVSNLFGIGKSTASRILHEFCNVIVDLFFYHFVKFPVTHDEIKETTDGFHKKFGYPMCVGALDGSHINIKPPSGVETDYFNYKKFYSVVLLAVVDSDLLFRYINVGAPGRCNDAFVYSKSSLSELIHSRKFEDHFFLNNNTKIQAHLIADSAFPLDRTLMKPFPQGPDLTREKSLFNYRLSRTRCCVERSFGLMKNRFRMLHKKMEFDIENSITIMKAAAVLHNICILSNDLNDIEWQSNFRVYKKPSCNVSTSTGVGVRNALTNYFLQHPL